MKTVFATLHSSWTKMTLRHAGVFDALENDR